MESWATCKAPLNLHKRGKGKPDKLYRMASCCFPFPPGNFPKPSKPAGGSSSAAKPTPPHGGLGGSASRLSEQSHPGPNFPQWGCYELLSTQTHRRLLPGLPLP